MRLLKFRKAQSLIEYAVLLAIVISAFLLLQGIVKRGLSGGINEAASRMGEQYSITSTATKESRTMTGSIDQTITEETGTSVDTNLTDILTKVGIDPTAVQGSIDKGAHNLTQRPNQNFTSKTESKTESSNLEVYKVSESPSTPVTDFTLSP
jgi:hypothetical protein